MKIRNGFVSNSSSSSFTCEICGRVETGYDANASEFEFVECENNHLFCDEELIGEAKSLLSIYEDTHDEDDENYDDGYQEIEDMTYNGCSVYPESACPICQFEVSSKPDIKNYLMKKYSVTVDEVFAEVKQKNPRRKKLYENEYVNYVYAKYNIQELELLASLKKEFVTYKTFLEYINEN